MTPKVETNSD